MHWGAGHTTHTHTLWEDPDCNASHGIPAQVWRNKHTVRSWADKVEDEEKEVALNALPTPPPSPTPSAPDDENDLRHMLSSGRGGKGGKGAPRSTGCGGKGGPGQFPRFNRGSRYAGVSHRRITKYCRSRQTPRWVKLVYRFRLQKYLTKLGLALTLTTTTRCMRSRGS